MSTGQTFIILGAISAALAVALGAFGAHALRATLDDYTRAIYQTAFQYHFLHALGIVAIGALLRGEWVPHSALWSGWLLLAGTLLFSGSLYLLAVTSSKWLGAITPFGGMAFIAGWLWLAWSARLA